MIMMRAITLRHATEPVPGVSYAGPFSRRAPAGTASPKVILVPVSSVPDYDTETRRWIERLQVSVYATEEAAAVLIRDAWEAWIEKGEWDRYGVLLVHAAPEMRQELLDEDAEGYHVFVDMICTVEEAR